MSISGQQHGTVYWAKGAGETLLAMSADATDGSRPSSVSGSPGFPGKAGGRGKTLARTNVVGADTEPGAGAAGVVATASAATLTVSPTAEGVGAAKGTAPREEGLAEAFAGCFAVEDSPIWADGSTEEYAAELEERMGGAARLAELTGSRAHLRQGAPQIMKVGSRGGRRWRRQVLRGVGVCGTCTMIGIIWMVFGTFPAAAALQQGLLSIVMVLNAC